MASGLRENPAMLPAGFIIGTTEISVRLRRYALVMSVLLVFCVPATCAETMTHANSSRMQNRIEALSKFGGNPEGGVSRVACSEADLAGRAWLVEEMVSLGLDVRIDTAGNIIGRRSGRFDLSAARMQQVHELITAEASTIASAKGTTISFTELDTASPLAPTDPSIRDVIASAAKSLGYSYQRMPSGAGHDAQDLATITPGRCFATLRLRAAALFDIGVNSG